MGCPTSNMATVRIEESEFNALGFFLVKRESTLEQYVFNQYTLWYDTQTFKVVVAYTGGTSIMDYKFVSIVHNALELETYLRRNGVIV